MLGLFPVVCFPGTRKSSPLEEASGDADGELIAASLGLCSYSPLDLRLFQTFATPPVWPALPTALSALVTAVLPRQTTGHVTRGPPAARSTQNSTQLVSWDFWCDKPILPAGVSKPHRVVWDQTWSEMFDQRWSLPDEAPTLCRLDDTNKQPRPGS